MKIQNRNPFGLRFLLCNKTVKSGRKRVTFFMTAIDKKAKKVYNKYDTYLSKETGTMTDELMEQIKRAEEEGAGLKSAATLNASKTVSEAELKAEKTAKDSEEFCRAYKETQTSLAQAQAEREYAAAIEKSRADAKAYAQKSLEHTEMEVSKIVGRMISGNR